MGIAYYQTYYSVLPNSEQAKQQLIVCQFHSNLFDPRLTTGVVNYKIRVCVSKLHECDNIDCD